MKLNNNYRIEKSGSGFILYNTREGKDKGGNPKNFDEPFYYGTVYQALQAFIEKASTEELDLYNIGIEISSILSMIEEAKETIKAEFRTEVMVTR